MKKGRFARGGSTITQQLAKNLYFTTRKSVTRKLRELIVTRWLEEDLTKRRILELYLNVIEWGDGVYGVRGGGAALLRQVRRGPRRHRGRGPRGDDPEPAPDQPARATRRATRARRARSSGSWRTRPATCSARCRGWARSRRPSPSTTTRPTRPPPAAEGGAVAPPEAGRPGNHTAGAVRQRATVPAAPATPAPSPDPGGLTARRRRRRNLVRTLRAALRRRGRALVPGGAGALTLELLRPSPGRASSTWAAATASSTRPLVDAGHRVTVSAATPPCGTRCAPWTRRARRSCGDLLHAPSGRSFDVVLALRLLPHARDWRGPGRRAVPAGRARRRGGLPDARSVNAIAGVFFGARRASKETRGRSRCSATRRSSRPSPRTACGPRPGGHSSSSRWCCTARWQRPPWPAAWKAAPRCRPHARARLAGHPAAGAWLSRARTGPSRSSVARS